MMHLFVDTNFFLQYNSYDTIDWPSMFQGDIFIIIPRIVLKEIDNHKNSDSKRRSRRARSSVSLIRALMNSPKESRKKGFLLKIGLMERFDFSIKKKNFLDLTKADDSIANEVLVWAENNPGKEYCVVTGDIGLIVTCHDCDIPCHELPDSWKLPPEPDDRDRKIKELEANIQLLCKKTPNLTIETDKEIYEVDVKLYHTLLPQEITELSNKIFITFPEKQDFALDVVKSEEDRMLEDVTPSIGLDILYGSRREWYLPKPEDIEEYHKVYTLNP